MKHCIILVRSGQMALLHVRKAERCNPTVVVCVYIYVHTHVYIYMSCIMYLTHTHTRILISGHAFLFH